MAFVNLLEAFYPVGSIYISTVSTSPSSVIGGTWARITDAVLRGTSSSIGYIGSDSHTQTIDEMPAHTHSIYFKRRNLSSESGYAYTMQTSTTEPDDSSTYFMPLDEATGGGQPMSLMQHSYNCYIWYRTA